MRKLSLSLCVAVSTSSFVLASGSVTHAVEPWFGPAVSSPINNSAGPGPAPQPSDSADVNNDGDADVVSIGDLTLGDVRVSLGHGDGTFAADTKLTGTSSSQALDLGDVNGDGNVDLVTMSATKATVLVGDGTGSFSKIGSYPLTLGGQVQPVLVDVDDDGDLDLIAPTFGAIQSLINTGGGQLTPGPRTRVVGAPVISAITVATINPGSIPDLFAVDGFSGTTISLTGNGDGSFAVKDRLYATGFIPEDVSAIDLDGDGFDDVATVGSFSFSLATGLTNGKGGFRSSFPAKLQFAGPGPTSAAVADLDGDGREDLVVSSLANPAHGTLTVLAGNGTASMRKVGTYNTASFQQNPVLADYDNDGDIDIVAVSPGAISFVPNTIG